MNEAGSSVHPDAARQLAFARHLRDPEHCEAPPGLDPDRVATYRRLFFNNVEGVLSANFPVISRLLPIEQWRALVRRFYAEHASHAPLFTELSREFVDYLAQLPDPPRPFLAELAHYEWVELALMLDQNELAEIPVAESTDLLLGQPVLSPCAWLLAYRYPVHAIRPEFQPVDPPAEPSFLVVYRNRSDQIGFMALSRVSARLMELLREGDRCGLEVLGQLAQELGMPLPQLQPLAQAELQRWLERDVVLGSRVAGI